MRSRLWINVVVASVLLVSAGCWWAQPGAGPGNTFANVETHLTVDNVATLEQAWSGRGGLSAVVNGVVVGAYWTGTGVDVVAHDFTTGDETWSRTLTPPGVVSGFPTHAPVVTGSSVWTGYVARTATATCAFGLARLDLATGSLLGTDTSYAPTELVPFGDKVAMAGGVYSPVLDMCAPPFSDPLRVVDAATGTTEWMSGGIASGHRITQVGDAIYLSTAGLRRYAAAGCGAPTCNPIWSSQATGTGSINSLAGERSGPLFALAPISFGQMGLFTIDPATGTPLASTPLAFDAFSLAVADHMVFVAGTTGVAAYDAASCAAGSGVLLWSAATGGQVTWANGLAVAGGVVYVGREDGVVEAYAESGCGAPTCSPVTSVSTGGTVLQLAVAQGQLLVGTLDTVTAFAPAG